MRRFSFRLPPFDHQLEEYLLSRDMPSRCLWWEMGAGKTKVMIDTAAHLFTEGRIAGMVALAPNGVHQNWSMDEIPAHLPPELEGEARVFTWESDKRKRVWFREAWDDFRREGGFPILCVSYDSIMTRDSAKAVKWFLESRPCLYVADETSYPGAIKTADSKTAKRVLASARYAPYRRVLDGTPVDDSPFQAWTQCRFADPEIWRRELGISTFQQFKTYFGEWVQCTKHDEIDPRTGRPRAFKKLTRYRNMDRLHQIMDSIGSRVLKKDVFDLPPKLYEKVYFKPNADQRRMYGELERDFRAWFGDGSRVTAELAIVRMTRLQQILSGYAPADREEDLRPIGGGNPRIEALLDTVARIPGQALVWGKYDIDIDLMMAALRGAGHTCVQYDGRVSGDEKLRARRAYQAGEAKFFVAKTRSAGRGLTLTAGDKAIYYNRSFSLDQARQSEDRPHRPGQRGDSVTYIDIVADVPSSVDRYILAVLRRKRQTAGTVMGDDLPPWI